MKPTLITAVLPLFISGVGMTLALSPAIGQSLTVAQAKTPTWQDFSSKTGSFTISMPGTPAESVQPLETPMGEIKNYAFTSKQQDGKVTYSVSYVDLPDVVTSMNSTLVLEMVASGLVNNDNVKVLKEQATKLQEHPGRTFKLSTPGDKLTHHHAYLVKNRLYQVVVEHPVAQEVALMEDVERFFTSFKLQP